MGSCTVAILRGNQAPSTCLIQCDVPMAGDVIVVVVLMKKKMMVVTMMMVSVVLGLGGASDQMG